MEPKVPAPYGLVLICPKCPTKDYFGMLKTPGNKASPCPNCGTALIALRRRSRGQALVELALVLPILLFTLLGSLEAGFLLIAKADQDRATQVIVDWAIEHQGESWNSVANHILPGCIVTVESPSRDLSEATSECPYRPKIGLPLFDRITIGSRESAAAHPPKTEPIPAVSPS